jgi:DNA-binding HxlR family transcriptional regulator
MFYKNIHHTTENCANIEIALDIFVGKWMPIILFHLFSNDKMRFSELQLAIPEISKKMLSNHLRELEFHDIIKEKYLQKYHHAWSIL